MKKPEKTPKTSASFGKPIDIFALKSGLLGDNFLSHLSHIRSTRKALFNSRKLEKTDKCPICGRPSGKSSFLVDIYGARYHQCPECSHSFLIERPGKDALERFYSSNSQYASTYADKKKIRARVEDVARPKASWAAKQFKKLYGRKPHRVVDIGAGAGHFVYACNKLGINSCGVELSASCIDFSRKHFGIKLNAVDFIKSWKMFKNTDIVTFWGVIEHVPNPVALLKAAQKALSGKEGLVIAEVPRWDSVSTMVQQLFSDTVVRHLDPLGHINLFTEASLLRAFEISGFSPVAAWYFGMDGYELVTQLSHFSNDKSVIKSLKKHVNAIQKRIDRKRLSDTIVLAGKNT